MKPDSQDGVVLVTGATGFLGGALVRRLLADGVPVRAVGRNLAAGLVLEAAGADFRPVDLTDAPAVMKVCEGVRCVVHAAALSSAWGRYRDFVAANVTATANVIEACRANGVRRLVHISSPSVMSRHCVQENLDERHPLPETFVSMYSETKARAEELVRASGQEAVILRPKAIYGPGDRALFPRIVEGLKKGRLPIIGDGVTLTDITHVDDVVQACLLAMEAEAASGNTYLVTGGEPVNLWEVVALIAEKTGCPAPTRKIPVKKALRIGGILEALWRLLPLPGEPPLTRYKASVLGYTQTYDITAARRDLGYEPKVQWRAGVQGFLDSLQAAPADSPPEGAPSNSPPPEGDSSSLPLKGDPLRIDFRVAGHTLARERFMGTSKSWKTVRIPALFAVLHHPTEGPVLFDTGYGHRFYESTERFPFRIYRMLTPVDIRPEEDAARQVEKMGLDPAGIRWVILSHFDPDHMGGLKDFPKARVVCHHEAWAAAAGLEGWAALRARILPGLVPEDMAARLKVLPDPGGPVFPGLGPTLDLFGDGTIRLVSLPGHAPGHLGALVRSSDGRDVLLCGDACWSRAQIATDPPRPGVHRRIAFDKGQQEECYRALRALTIDHPDLALVPTHCREAAAEVTEKE